MNWPATSLGVDSLFLLAGRPITPFQFYKFVTGKIYTCEISMSQSSNASLYVADSPTLAVAADKTIICNNTPT